MIEVKMISKTGKEKCLCDSCGKKFPSTILVMVRWAINGRWTSFLWVCAKCRKNRLGFWRYPTENDGAFLENIPSNKIILLNKMDLEAERK